MLRFSQVLRPTPLAPHAQAQALDPDPDPDRHALNHVDHLALGRRVHVQGLTRVGHP